MFGPLRLFKRNHVLLLILIFGIGLLVRFIHFNHITFGYDQARDAFMAIDIIKGDHLKIVGPNTDIFGLNHGVLYWYLMAPVYFLFGGSVSAAKLFLVLVNLGGIFTTYYVGSKVFNNTRIGLLSAFLYAVSFEAVQYARWLSNPSPALVTTLLSFYGLWLLLKSNQKGLLLFFIFWPLSVQFEFFLVSHIVLFMFVYGYMIVHENLKIDFRRLVSSAAVGLLLLSPLIIEQVKYGFRGIVSLLAFLGTDKSIVRSAMANYISFLDKIINTFYWNISGLNLFVAGILAVCLLVYSVEKIRSKSQLSKPLIFSVFILLSPMILFPFEKLTANFVTLGNLYGAIFLVAFALDGLLASKKLVYKYAFVLIMLVIFAGNLSLISSQGKKGEILFSVQKSMTYNDETALIDWVYKDAAGKEFSINTITNPLFINTTWAYLFDHYGRNTYGYMPGWAGTTQVDVFGGNITMGLTDISVAYAPLQSPRIGKLLYLIAEPETGIPLEYFGAYEAFENKRSKLLESHKFGTFVVEKRIYTSDEDVTAEKLFNIARGKK
ncbi:MAG: hypothetical protein WC775_03290 [Patescibacteria group bacterium]|jgi:hypothetical protein